MLFHYVSCYVDLFIYFVIFFFFFFYCFIFFCFFFFFSSRRRHTRWNCDWNSDVCSSDLPFSGMPSAMVLPVAVWPTGMGGVGAPTSPATVPSGFPPNIASPALVPKNFIGSSVSGL